MVATISRNSESVKEPKQIKTQRYLICFYFFISFFEPYLNGILGSVTKYYILLLMFYILFVNKNVEFKPFHWCYVFWLAYKFCSVLWATNTFIYEMYRFSQIGMVALLIMLSNTKPNKKTINSITNTMWIGSVSIGILSLFLSHPYHGVVAERQVLYLFGQEADPNNQAAFLLVGIAIALYTILCKKKKIIISIATMIINIYSVFLTGSRGGLIGTVCIVLFIVLFGVKKQVIRKLGIVFFIALAAFIMFYLAKEFLPEIIYKRLFTFSSYEGGSERDIIWKKAWQLITYKSNFVFGSGWGSYYGYNNVYTVLHNTYLSILCDVGIIGFVLFFAPIVTASIKLYKKGNILAILILLSGFAPSFFIEAIGKRFFWNVILLLFMNYVYEMQKSDKSVCKTLQ